VSQRFDLGVRPHLGFTGSGLDRAAELRRDPAATAALAADPRGRTLVIAGELVCLHKGEPFHDPTFTFTQAAALVSGPDQMHEQVFLGRDGEEALFAVAIDPDAAKPLSRRSDLLVADLRSLATGRLVARKHLPPLAQAKSLLRWHAGHRRCSNCGAPTRITHAGWRRDCADCGAEHFPRTDPVVIMLAIDGERCLLGRQSRFAKGMWSCLAGFIEPGETIEDAVRREILEEAGIVCGRVSYFASQPWPFPMSLMIGCHTQALTTELKVDHCELEDARWFARDEVAAMVLRQHPDGLTATHPFAIAHHIIRAWLEADRSLF
jgi:NAD+ diphosphatase